VEAGTDSTIYVRSRHNETHKVSRAVSAKLSVAIKMLSAALLDKSGWVYIDSLSDEFDYSQQFPHLLGTTFSDKWALNYCWGPSSGGQDPCSAGEIGNHYINNTEIWCTDYNKEYYNHGNQDGKQVDGSGGEVTFKDGVARLTATRLQNQMNLFCHTIPTTKYFKSGMLYSKRRFNPHDDGAIMVELRCKMPNEVGTYPAFWIFGDNGEIDFYDQLRGYNDTFPYEGQYNGNKNKIALIDRINQYQLNGKTTYSTCSRDIYKQTPCDYTEDWHTITGVISEAGTQFFVDGKEIWAHESGSGQFAMFENIDGEFAIIINLAVLDWASFGINEPQTFLLDYIRVYGTAAGNDPDSPDIYQNIQNDEPATLENVNYPLPALNHGKIVVGQPIRLTTNIDLNKITALNNGQNVKLFYKGTNKAGYQLSFANNHWKEDMMMKYKIIWLNGPTVVFTNWFDIKSDITPVNENIIYYQSINNELKRLKRNGATPTAWLETRATWMHQPLLPLKNCAGNIIVAANGNVWYKGTNNRIYCWNPTNGSLFQLPTALDVHSFVMDKCGCLFFYRDNIIGALHQVYWWNNWGEIHLPELCSSSYGNMLLDNSKSRLYYISPNNSVRYYNYNYSTYNAAGIFTLGNHAELNTMNNKNLCSAYNNALAGLTIGPDTQSVYYLGTDLRMWYFFNDRENSNVVKTSGNPPVPISRENWNKTPLNYNAKTLGMLVFEPGNTGRLFYPGSDRKLNIAYWTAANSPDQCLIDTATWSYANSYRRMDTTQINISDKETELIKLLVYPNPSDHSFTFEIANFKETVMLEVSDITGKVVFRQTGNEKIKWQATGETSGVYFYKVSMPFKNYTGKLIKM
jgi:hypothetical protein